MKPNAILTHSEMIRESWNTIKLFRCSRRRDVARSEIYKLRKYLALDNREEMVQIYADHIEPFRNNRQFHSASVSGFFNVTGAAV